jgi:TRAP-type C4-dicarboxylate transport system permease small subunit
VLAAVQIIPGLQIASAIAAVASPFALAFGVVYLLRVVFPRPDQGLDADASADHDAEDGHGAPGHDA